MPNTKETRWIILMLMVTAAVVAVVGLVFRFSASSIDNCVPPVISSTVGVPALASTREPVTLATAVQDAISTTIPLTNPPQPPTPTPQPFSEGPIIYGTSFGGRPLLAYRIGTGPSVRAIIGGIHGGYEWNTVELISKTLEHLEENSILVPDRVTLYVIPCANPDGYAAGTDTEHGRVNSSGVDLNRNWEYRWQSTATHGTRSVDAGAYAFSEPETAALRDFILERNAEAAIFYHSALARVFYGAETSKSASYELALVVSEATGYPPASEVPGKITTGDAVDWMSDQGLAGIEVELTTHEDVEWERNLQGLLAFLNWTPSSLPTQIARTIRIGTSVQGRPLEVTQVGNGDRVALLLPEDHTLVAVGESNLRLPVSHAAVRWAASAGEAQRANHGRLHELTQGRDGLDWTMRTSTYAAQ